MRSEPANGLAEELGDFVEAFELALLRGPADLRAYLPSPGHPLYPAVRRELIRVDLEHSWRCGWPRGLEEYRHLCPEVFQDQASLQEIAYEEYRLRRQAGEAPSLLDYQQRYGVTTSSWARQQGPAELQGRMAGAEAGGPSPPDRGFLPQPRPHAGSSTRKVDSVLAELLGHARPAAHETAWGFLELLLNNLQNCDRTAEQIRFVLQSLRDSLDADIVFWYASATDEVTEMAGNRNLPPAWCRAFTRRMLEATPGAAGQLLRSTLPPSAEPAVASPESLAMIQVSKSRPTWIVALSFDPDRRFDTTDVRIMGLARRMLLNQRQHLQTAESLKETLFGLMHCLTIVIDSRDSYTCGHSERVARIAVRLGQEMRLPLPVVSDIYLAGLLHDIGKIGIEDSVLRKPGKLTPEEFDQLKTHVFIGDRIVATIKHFGKLRPGVRHHHERYDGKGYPDGLAGQGIPLMARILAVADSCDAMMSARPYRPGMPTAQIDAIMSEGAGTQWDPVIIRHFQRCRAELYPICQQGIGSSVRLAVEHALRGMENGSLPGAPSLTPEMLRPATPSAPVSPSSSLERARRA